MLAQVLNIRCLTDSQRLMVVDSHGKIQYATSTLAALVGTKVTALTQMHIQALMPSPTAQLHKGWVKVGGNDTWVSAGAFFNYHHPLAVIYRAGK